MTKHDLSVRAVIAALMLLIPNIVSAQDADPVADRAAIEKVMYDYVAAYGDGDMDRLMQDVQFPLTVGGPNGFRSLATSDDAVAVYTKIRDAGVKQGYAKSEWLDFGVKLLGPSYAIAGGSFIRYKADGSEFNRGGGTYLLTKVDGIWKVGVGVNYPVEDALVPQ
jgi:NTF2-like protein (DUF6841)